MDQEVKQDKKKPTPSRRSPADRDAGPEKPAPAKQTRPVQPGGPAKESSPAGTKGAGWKGPRILAVGSGKGGVGKTTTSVNLALAFSKQGIPTLLVDADPLSDIATLLDLEEPEAVLEASANRPAARGKDPDLAALAVPVFSNLKLLAGRGKESAARKGGQSTAQSAALLKKLLSPKGAPFLEEFALVILDLPAGLMAEEGMDFLKKTNQVAVVTNDEPTSHVSAGAFIREAAGVSGKLSFKVWHNKYRGIGSEGFDPQDLPGNYNRNVPEEQRLDFARLDIRDAAYIPEDPSLDLLQSSPDLNLNIKRQMLERIEMMYRQRISQILDISRISGRLVHLLENYLYSLETIGNGDEILEYIGRELTGLLAGSIFSGVAGERPGDLVKDRQVFTPEEKDELLKIIRILKDDNLSASIRKLRRLLGSVLEEEENSQRLFFQGTDQGKMKVLDREISLFLALLSGKSSRSGPVIRNLGGLLLYDFALFKLFKSETIRNLIIGFIPWRENSQGRKIRDKNRQIRWLVEDDGEYRKKFLALVKTLFPVLLSQLKGVAGALEVNSLLFQKGGQLNREVYLKLLTAFLHDVLNSGLGVVIGFRYRPASRAFQKGAAFLLEALGNDAAPQKASAPKAPAPKGTAPKGATSKASAPKAAVPKAPAPEKPKPEKPRKKAEKKPAKGKTRKSP